jgi:hypothetical protein
MPHIFFTDEEHQLMVDKAIRLGFERFDSEIANLRPRLSEDGGDVDALHLLLFKQWRPYAAVYLALAATARIVTKNFGGDQSGEQAFINGAMDHVYEISGSIEIPDNIANKLRFAPEELQRAEEIEKQVYERFGIVDVLTWHENLPEAFAAIKEAQEEAGIYETPDDLLQDALYNARREVRTHLEASVRALA